MKLQAYEFYEIHDGKENYRKTFTTLKAAKKYYTRMTMQGALLRARVDGSNYLFTKRTNYSGATMKYSEIVDHYGAKHQAIKAVEELNELAVELSKWVNGQGSRKKILEECADVEIMLWQMQIIFGDWDDWKAYKLGRVEGRIWKEQE